MGSASGSGAHRNPVDLLSTRPPLLPGHTSRGRIAPAQVHESGPFSFPRRPIVALACTLTHSRTKNTHCVVNLHCTPQKTLSLFLCPPARLGRASPDTLSRRNGTAKGFSWGRYTDRPANAIRHLQGLLGVSHHQTRSRAAEVLARVRDRDAAHPAARARASKAYLPSPKPGNIQDHLGYSGTLTPRGL